MLRLFIAIKLNDSVIEQLQNICFGVKNARWLPSEQLHLTIRFIGDCDETMYHDIISVLEHISLSSFNLSIKGVGYFPPRGNPRILWAGLQPSPELQELHLAINKKLHTLGLTEERRKFYPHITLARLREKTSSRAIVPFITRNSLFKIAPFHTTAFHLYSSILRREGALHQIEKTFDLM